MGDQALDVRTLKGLARGEDVELRVPPRPGELTIHGHFYHHEQRQWLSGASHHENTMSDTVVDDACASTLWFSPEDGGSYVVQFDYLGKGNCTLSCYVLPDAGAPMAPPVACDPSVAPDASPPAGHSA